MSDPVVIVSVARTPLGGFQGDLASLTTPQLGAVAIRSAVERARLKPEQVEEVIMGCVLPAGVGQAPARQAALGAGLPLSAGCTTINKVCGSGMKATMLAHDLILAGSNEVMVAGGMESMSNAPHMLPNSRTGNRYGGFQAVDHMAFDGLTNAYDGQPMGVFGEACVEKYGFTREQQDAWAIESVKRAQAAQANGAFADEIVPVTIATRKGEVQVGSDEQPGKSDIGKIPTLRAAFKKDGTITAASSSSISDGAAALVLMSAEAAAAHGAAPLARLVAQATHSHQPEWFTTAPIGAIEKVLDKAGWKAADVDLFEINEAFAVVAMAPVKELGLDPAKVNVNGGACALGHPIGASGARLVVTLVNALRIRGLRRGVAALCIGGGEATAVAIELI